MAKVTFNNKYSPFFDALKSKVDNYFTSNNIKPVGNSKLFTKAAILISTAVIIYSVLVFFTPPVWISVLLCCLMGFNLAAIGFNVMHDGAHGSFSNHKWVNEIMAYSLNLMGGSSYLWKIKHNVIHHTYTNIEGMDDDIDIKPWMRVNIDQPKWKIHRFQHIYGLFLYGLSYFMWVYYLDFKKYFTRKIAENKMRKMETKEHIIFWLSKIVYTGLFLVLPIYKVGFLDTLIGYSIIVLVTGIVISVVFQLAHVVEDLSFPVPNPQNNKIENEWAVHQIETTANFATKSKLVSWYVGGLNFQVEHHLFPKISHVHYPQINKFVRETCEQFNLNYLEFPTMFGAFKSHLSHLKHIGVAA